MTPTRREKIRGALSRLAANVAFLAKVNDVRSRQALVERLTDDELENIIRNAEFIVEEALGTDA